LLPPLAFLIVANLLILTDSLVIFGYFYFDSKLQNFEHFIGDKNANDGLGAKQKKVLEAPLFVVYFLKN
jgi:hypothetical protein